MAPLASLWLAVCSAFAAADTGTPPFLVPLPRHWERLGPSALSLATPLRLEVQTNEAGPSPTIEAAFQRLLSDALPQPGERAGTVKAVRVAVADADEAPPQQDTDEAYSLRVDGGLGRVEIQSATVCVECSAAISVALAYYKLQ